MRFPAVPKESRNQIKKAGRILVDRSASMDSRVLALELVDRWRASHGYPINTFQSTLHDKLGSGTYAQGYFIAQRLKRMPTIMRKLRNEPTMQITTMQDIGGLRAVVNSLDQVYQLVSDYVDNSRFKHGLHGENDYIVNPKKSGYRSYHLIYKYKNKKRPSYNGLLLELQIRTKLQHSWATAVEIMETFTGEALKSSQGSKEWLDFFALTSSAFAHLEGMPPVPGYEHLSLVETFKAVKEAEKVLRVKEKMTTFPLVIQNISAQPQASHYHLIILDSDNKTVTVKSYSRDSLKQATEDYAKCEAEAIDGRKLEPVLVSATQLKRAYPNFFLNATDFVRNLDRILAKA